MRDLNRLIRKVSSSGVSLQAIIFHNSDVKLNYIAYGPFLSIQQSCAFDNVSGAYDKISELIDKYRIPEGNCCIIEFTGEAELSG